MRKLHLTRTPTGQWTYLVQHDGHVMVPEQYGTYDRESTIEQARGRFSFDAIAGAPNLPRIAREFYLDYVNNYLTVEKIAEHYEISEALAKALIDEGRR